MSSRAFITSEQRGALGFLPLARSTALSPTGGTAAPYVADDCNSVAGSSHYSSPGAFVRVLVYVPHQICNQISLAGFSSTDIYLNIVSALYCSAFSTPPPR